MKNRDHGSCRVGVSVRVRAIIRRSGVLATISQQTDRPIVVDRPMNWCRHCIQSWLRGTVVERQFLAGELSLSHAGLAADG